eukprot:1377170-Amphidinium_carterae.3
MALGERQVGHSAVRARPECVASCRGERSATSGRVDIGVHGHDTLSATTTGHRRKGWQKELGMLRKTLDTWSSVAQAFTTAHCARTHATGPHLHVGCQSMDLVACARRVFKGRVRLVQPPFLHSAGDLVIVIGENAPWCAKARQLMMANWWRLGLLLPHQSVQSLPEVNLSLEALLGALIERAAVVCAEEKQSRQASQWQGPMTHEHEAFPTWQDVEQAEGPWRSLLDEVRALFEARPSMSSWEPELETPWRQRLQQLVPWKLERVQVVKNPKTRRSPVAPWTHRGACLQYMSGHIAVESEELSSQLVPRSRFGAPVQFAIFWYGYAREMLPIASDEPQQPVRDVPAGIVQVAEGVRFLLGESAERIPRSTCQLVGKLHLQLGHLSQRELTRLLSSHGASAITLEAVSKLQCDTCDRARKVPPARAASAPSQPTPCFGDQLQCDFFHCMDLAGTSHTLLGIIDTASHLHVSRRVLEKAAAPTLHALLSAWITPFGVPVEIKADLDPAFRGKFAEGIATLGAELIHVPAEQHSQLGRIERHNAVLRTALLKLIDEQGVARGEELDLVLAAAVHAKNHLMRKAGVSPFIAAFGRLPRIPGELLDDGDQFASAAVTENEQIRRAMHLRLAAQKSMLDVQQLEALRAAILRKAPPGHEVNFHPGQRVAFYRTRALQRRGARVKRSGYIPATFVAYEAGPRRSNNAWVLAGSRVTLVSCSQLRPAIGFEQWIPDAEDHRNLEAAIRDGALHQLPNEIEIPPAPETEPLTEMDVASRYDHARSGMLTPVYPSLNLDDLPEVPEDDDPQEHARGVLDESLMRVRERERVI